MAYLRMLRITREFPGVVANDAVDLEVERGEIHALVGENGAGKSTLMNILYGVEQADAGRIFLDERPVSIPNPQVAIALGIGMVHQHFQLVPSLTVAENVTLGYEPRIGPFVDRERALDEVQALSKRFSLNVDPSARMADLSVGGQQRVEILKLLYRNANLLILDEPSAVLTPQEVEDLFAVLQQLVDDGRTAIFITHKLREVMAICKRATVLRRGRVIGTVSVAESSPAEITHMMVGQEISTERQTRGSSTGAARLMVRQLDVADDRGLHALKGISLTVHDGEILGIAGVEGNGQTELVETLVGLRKAESGDILLGGRAINHLRSRQRREYGMAIIPEDRTHEGLNLHSSVLENLISTRYFTRRYSRRGILRWQVMRELAARLIAEFDIRVRGSNTVVSKLSGGNAQKVVVARELAEQPKVVIAAQPTRGLDIAAGRFVHETLLRLRNAGTAILLVSADLDELLSITDRIAVLFDGRLLSTMETTSASRDAIGQLMVGRLPDANEQVNNGQSAVRPLELDKGDSISHG